MAKQRKVRRLPWHGKLDRFFFPVLGPAQVGPYDTPAERRVHDVTCPACRQPMSQHERRNVGGKARDYCPPTG